MTYDPFIRPADRPQPQRRPLWTFQKADSIYTCELVLHDGFGSEARVLIDGDLLVSRRFEHEWQALQWAEQERLFSSRRRMNSSVKNLPNHLDWIHRLAIVVIHGQGR